MVISDWIDEMDKSLALVFAVNDIDPDQTFWLTKHHGCIFGPRHVQVSCYYDRKHWFTQSMYITWRSASLWLALEYIILHMYVCPYVFGYPPFQSHGLDFDVEKYAQSEKVKEERCVECDDV